MSDYKDKKTTTLLYLLLSLLAAMFFAIPFYIVILSIVLYLNPAVVHIGNKEYPVMATGQILYSAVITLVVSVGFMWLVFRKIKREENTSI
jgi:uncharacterized BrkB/YihY/UPF0761 family membrane protein